MTFLLWNVSFARLALRRFVDDHELGDVNVSWSTVQLRCAFISLPNLFFDTGAVLLQALSVKCLKNGINTVPDKIESFFFGLGQATGHPVPENVLEVLVRAVRLMTVFRTRSFHRDERRLQYSVLESLQHEQQQD